MIFVIVSFCIGHLVAKIIELLISKQFIEELYTYEDIDNIMIGIKQLFDHDSFPTQRGLRANLSFVLMSYRQPIPIMSIMIKNRATNSPDNTEGVIFVKSLLLVFVS